MFKSIFLSYTGIVALLGAITYLSIKEPLIDGAFNTINKVSKDFYYKKLKKIFLSTLIMPIFATAGILIGAKSEPLEFLKVILCILMGVILGLILEAIFLYVSFRACYINVFIAVKTERVAAALFLSAVCAIQALVGILVFYIVSIDELATKYISKWIYPDVIYVATACYLVLSRVASGKFTKLADCLLDTFEKLEVEDKYRIRSKTTIHTLQSLDASGDIIGDMFGTFVGLLLFLLTAFKHLGTDFLFKSLTIAGGAILVAGIVRLVLAVAFALEHESFLYSTFVTSMLLIAIANVFVLGLAYAYQIVIFLVAVLAIFAACGYFASVNHMDTLMQNSSFFHLSVLRSIAILLGPFTIVFFLAHKALNLFFILDASAALMFLSETFFISFFLDIIASFADHSEYYFTNENNCQQRQIKQDLDEIDDSGNFIKMFSKLFYLAFVPCIYILYEKAIDLSVIWTFESVAYIGIFLGVLIELFINSIVEISQHISSPTTVANKILEKSGDYGTKFGAILAPLMLCTISFASYKQFVMQVCANMTLVGFLFIFWGGYADVVKKRIEKIDTTTLQGEHEEQEQQIKAMKKNAATLDIIGDPCKDTIGPACMLSGLVVMFINLCFE